MFFWRVPQGVNCTSGAGPRSDRGLPHVAEVARCRTYGAWVVVVWAFPALTGWANLCRAYGADWNLRSIMLDVECREHVPASRDGKQRCLRELQGLKPFRLAIV